MASSIGKWNTARNVITDTDITKIDNYKFSSEVARLRKHSIAVGANDIPTKITGRPDKNIPIYIVEPVLAFKTRCGQDHTLATNPGALMYLNRADEANRIITMAQEQEDYGVRPDINHQ